MKGSRKAGLTSTVSVKASRNEKLKADWRSMEPAKMMALVKARWKSKVSAMAPTKAPTKAEPKEAVSLPMGSENFQTTPETTEAENPPIVSAKAPTKTSLKAGLTSMVSEKASRNERLKADWISMGPEKMMAFLKARWKSKVSLKAPTKAGPKEAVNLLIGFEKVQKMAEPTEAESPPSVSAKAPTKGSLKADLTSTVSEKA
jgi:hypothetical protein